ncbi:MAG: hypothetical protein BWX73_01265 [Lentisphaerae bacterium ADurb.Bin082]|nr:MAG: hypothetical protein BWX73_01265 [Lentisphaerae bacterium ADurb.Bin082]
MLLILVVAVIVVPASTKLLVRLTRLLGSEPARVTAVLALTTLPAIVDRPVSVAAPSAFTILFSIQAPLRMALVPAVAVLALSSPSVALRVAIFAAVTEELSILPALMLASSATEYAIEPTTSPDSASIVAVPVADMAALSMTEAPIPSAFSKAFVWASTVEPMMSKPFSVSRVALPAFALA